MEDHFAELMEQWVIGWKKDDMDEITNSYNRAITLLAAYNGMTEKEWMDTLPSVF